MKKKNGLVVGVIGAAMLLTGCQQTVETEIQKEKEKKEETMINKQQEDVTKIEEDNEVKEEVINNFVQLKGKVDRFTMEEGDVQQIEVGTPDTMYVIKNKKPETIIDKEGNVVEIKGGEEFTAYQDANKPMLMIYPPQYEPFLMVLEKGEGNVLQTSVNKEFETIDNTLKLNISKETKILDKEMNKIEKETIVGKNILVFYKNTTRSIPAQTTPDKIIVLN